MISLKQYTKFTANSRPETSYHINKNRSSNAMPQCQIESHRLCTGSVSTLYVLAIILYWQANKKHANRVLAVNFNHRRNPKKKQQEAHTHSTLLSVDMLPKIAHACSFWGLEKGLISVSKTVSSFGPPMFRFETRAVKMISML